MVILSHGRQSFKLRWEELEYAKEIDCFTKSKIFQWPKLTIYMLRLQDLRQNDNQLTTKGINVRNLSNAQACISLDMNMKERYI